MRDQSEQQFGRRTTNVDLGGSERTSGIATFSAEQRSGLERLGYNFIYPLIGQSIADLRDAGNSFWSSWHKGYAFENGPSMRTEVALNRQALFLPDSNRKTLSEQLAIISQFSAEIERRVPGVIAKMGEASDYLRLAFAHNNSTGNRLFGPDDNFDYARTTTPTGGFYVAMVGYFLDRGLDVRDLHQDDGYGHVWAVPLIVPESAR
jgi:hypothetical protein